MGDAAGRGLLRLLLGKQEGPDGGVGAHQGALVAADAVVRQPLGHIHGDAALFVLGGLHLRHAVGKAEELADRDLVAGLGVDGDQHVPDVVRHTCGLSLLQGLVGQVLPAVGHSDLLHGLEAPVHSGVVHVQDLVALLEVAVGDGVLHVLDGLIHRQHAGELEERRLEDRVGPVAQTQLLGDGHGVDGIELHMVPGQRPLHVVGQIPLQLLPLPQGVQQEGAAGLHLVDDVIGVDVTLLVAGHEVRLGDVVGRADGLLAEAQVAFGDAAGLLGVIFKIRLDVLGRVVADDLDGVLVGAHGAVGAQAPELALDGGAAGGADVFPHVQRAVGHIVHDAHGEVVFLLAGHVVVHSLHLGGGGVLGAEAVPAGQHLDPAAPGFRQGGAHILIQGLADGAGLLGPVQDGDGLDGIRQLGQEVGHGEGAVQMDLDHAHLFALGVQVVDDLPQGAADAAHGDDHPVRVRRAVVVEQLVVPPRQVADGLHVFLHDGGQAVIGAVAGLPVLEEGVRVLDGVADRGMLAVQGPGLEAADGVPVHQAAHVVVVQHLDLLDLMGGSEALKEVLEGDAALDGGEMGYGAQVHALLHAGGGQLGEARLAAAHDVRVVAEDGQAVGGHRPGGDVHDTGQHGARDSVHGRDHQQQALGGGVGGGQGSGLQRAVHGAAGAGLGLELHQLHRLAEDILHASGGPLIHVVCHGAGGRDGVDRRHFRERVGDIGGCLVAVHGLEFLEAHAVSLLFSILSGRTA